MPSILDTLPVVYIAIGVGVILVALRFWQMRGWPPLFRGCPMRANRLTWIGVLTCMLAYLGTVQLAVFLMPAPNPEAKDDASQRMRITRVAVMNTAAQVVGASACLVIAALSFRRGLRGFGLSTRRLPADVFVAGALLLGFEPIGLLLMWLSQVVMSALGIPLPEHTFVEFLHDPNTPRYIEPLLWIAPVVIAPIAEETFFRGMLQTVLRRTLRSRVFAVLVAAGIFGLAHYGQPQAVLPLFVFGLLNGFAYERTGSLVGPITFHAMFNLKNLVWQMLIAPAPPPHAFAVLNWG